MTDINSRYAILYFGVFYSFTHRKCPIYFQWFHFFCITLTGCPSIVWYWLSHYSSEYVTGTTFLNLSPCRYLKMPKGHISSQGTSERDAVGSLRNFFFLNSVRNKRRKVTSLICSLDCFLWLGTKGRNS